jgi:hypothetical protein
MKSAENTQKREKMTFETDTLRLAAYLVVSGYSEYTMKKIGNENRVMIVFHSPDENMYKLITDYETAKVLVSLPAYNRVIKRMRREADPFLWRG